MYRAQAVVLSDALGAFKKVPLRLQQPRQVARGDPDVRGSLGQASFVGFQHVKDEGRHGPEAAVLWPDLQPRARGRALSARHMKAFRRNIGNLPAGLINRLPQPAGDIHSKAPQGRPLVFMLRARFVAVDRYTARAVPQANRRGNLVSVLPARPRGLVDVDVALFEQRFVVQAEVVPVAFHLLNAIGPRGLVI